MAVTVQDVATKAGVSPATVSRVLNRNTEVATETKTAVENAISNLGYRREATRRGRRPVATIRTRLAMHSLALLIPDNRIDAMLTPLTGQLLHGAESVARDRQYHFLLTRLSDDGGLAPCLATPGQVDGVIVRSGSMLLPTALPKIPTVWVFKSAQLASYGDMVHPDNEAIGEIAARYLLRRGARKFAVVNCPPGHIEGSIRQSVFERAARSAGASVRVIDIPSAQMSEIGALVASMGAVEGVFLPIDGALLALVRAAREAGREVGKDLDVISCSNDYAKARALAPLLPNIDIRADEIGRMAAETLLWRIQHPAEHRRVVLVEPRLVAAGDSRGVFEESENIS